MLSRQSDTREWLPGTVQDISESGISFLADQSLCAGIDLEMMFVMAREIAGQANSKVLCRSEIIRTAGTSGKYVNAGYSFGQMTSAERLCGFE